MITIRSARPSDLETTKKLIRKIFPNAMVQVSPDDTVLLAEYGGKAIGFAHIIYDCDKVLLQGIGVETSLRGQGVGSILLEHVLEVLKNEELPIYLKVKPLNPALDLYSRCGFMVKRFGQDAHVLVKRTNT